MYDGMLRLNLPANAEIIGFADDIAIVLIAKTIPQIEALCNQVVDMVENWLNEASHGATKDRSRIDKQQKSYPILHHH